MSVFPTLVKRYVHPEDVPIDPRKIRGRKMLLLNMPIREDSPPNCLPNGLAVLAAQLRDNGAEPVLVDLNAYRFFSGEFNAKSAFGLLWLYFKKHGGFDAVCLSGMITTLRWQEEIAKMVRRLQPNAFLVSGGGLATQFKGQLFNWIPELDAVSHSEGDHVILKILHDAVQIKTFGFSGAHLQGKLDPYHVGEYMGRQRFIYEGGRPRNLDDVPFPAYDLLERDIVNNPILDKYVRTPIWGGGADNSSATTVNQKKSINMISSRGCPHSCSFCFRGTTGERNYGVRSASKVFAEIKYFHDKYGIDFFGILDDNFMINRRRISEMAALMEDWVRRTGVGWGAHGRLDEAADLSLRWNQVRRVDDMARAGCAYIGFGGESADTSVLAAMGKGGQMLSGGLEKINGRSFPRTMLEGVRNARRAGIQANLTWIMGHPGESLENLKNTVAFIGWQEGLGGSVNRSLFLATAYPGTRMFGLPKVREVLGREFGISWGDEGEPVVDASLHDYVVELADATKLIIGKTGRPLNYSDMTDDQFLGAKFHAEHGQIEKILEMR